jgi:hypothetical protein
VLFLWFTIIFTTSGINRLTYRSIQTIRMFRLLCRLFCRQHRFGRPTPAEIAEFRRLLENARELDQKTGQKDCELAEKKQRLKDLLDKLGVDTEGVL